MPDRFTLPAGVLWDMDGTLIDTEPYWIEQEQRLVERFGGTWTHEDGLQLVGLALDDSATLIREQTPVDLPVVEIVETLQAGVIARMAQQMPWRPGARELLLGLRDAQVPCALVTMSWRPMADVLVASLPEGTWQAVVTGDVVRAGKPDPEAYLTGAAALGLAPADCVAIEDSPSGVRSALSAGARTLLVPHAVEVPHLPGLFRTESLVGVGPDDLLPLTTP